jgi:Rha family phage regulatory protein
MTDITTGTTTSALSTSVTPDLAVIDGHITTTSLQVAEHFGKRHDRVLRAIRNLMAEMPAEHLPIFGEIQIDVDLGMGRTRQDPAFRMTRDGFTLLAMGFTGKEALQWKLAYLSAFNKMESALSAPTLTIAPAQAQHLRELVQLVVESGQQNHGETWTRMHRKMKVNSYLALRPDQFDAACEYLRGKFDDTSIAAIAQKHFPQIAQLPAPAATTNMQLDVKTLCAMIHGGLIDQRAFIDIAYAVNQRQFKIACANQRRGYGQEVAEKIKSSMSDSDLHIINVAASMETWMRTTQPGVAA